MWSHPCVCGNLTAVDNGILVVESWLISATEYIAIDNTPLWPRIHVGGRPDQSTGYAKFKSTTLVLLPFIKNKHCFILFVFDALGVEAKVSWLIPCVLPKYTNHVSLA